MPPTCRQPSTGAVLIGTIPGRSRPRPDVCRTRLWSEPSLGNPRAERKAVKLMKKTLCAGLLMAVMPGLALAQVARTGSMQGTVKDPDALAIPGVTVAVTSEALIRTDLTATTDENGFYRLLSLPPGLYSVRFEIDGFQPLVRQEIRVSLSATTNLNATLTVGEIGRAHV